MFASAESFKRLFAIFSGRRLQAKIFNALLQPEFLIWILNMMIFKSDLATVDFFTDIDDFTKRPYVFRFKEMRYLFQPRALVNIESLFSFSFSEILSQEIVF